MAPLLQTSIAQSSNEPPPNIILILAEDFGFGDPACYGHPYSRTPNMDRLASEGTMFRRFYVTGMTCAPSRTGFMTGRHPASYPNYMADFGYQGAQTVTEKLGAKNYITGHYGKWHLGPTSTSGTYGIDDVSIVGPRMGHEEGKDVNVFEDAIGFIEANMNSKRPFYLNVWTHIAHSPVKPDASLVARFSDIRVDRSDFGKHMQDIFDESETRGDNDSTLDNSMQNYLAEIWSLDLQIGKLLDKLDKEGLAENTLIVFTSDQGAVPPMGGQGNPEFMLGYAGGLRGGKHSFYEGGVRTPFIVRWPGRVPSGKINDNSIISSLDWLPTVSAIAGASFDPMMFEGEDISDILQGSDRSRFNPLFWKRSTTRSQKSILYKNWKLHISQGNKGIAGELAH